MDTALVTLAAAMLVLCRPLPTVSVNTTGFTIGTFLMVEIWLNDQAKRKLQEHKKATVARLQEGTLLPYPGTLEGLGAQCLKVLSDLKALYPSGKLELDVVEVAKDGGYSLALSDDALRTLVSEQVADKGGLPRVKVSLTVSGTLHSRRQESRDTAAQLERKGKNQTNTQWLGKYIDKLQALTNDYWRGLIKILDTHQVRCLHCGEIIREIAGRPLDLKRVETHLHHHATRAAKSDSATAKAKQPPTNLPDVPSDVPHALTAEQLSEAKKGALDQDLFLSCLGKVFDLWNPWRAGLEAKGFKPDAGLLPVILMNMTSTSNAEKKLKQKAQALRAERLKLQREAAAQRKVQEATEKLEKTKAAVQAGSVPKKKKTS